MSTLSPGSLQNILRGDVVHNAILQILELQKLYNKTGGEHYRLFLSDGLFDYSYVTLANEIQSFVSDKLSKFTVIRLHKYYLRQVYMKTGKKLILEIHSLSIVEPSSKVGRNIGNAIVEKRSSRYGADSAVATQRRELEYSKRSKENYPQNQCIQQNLLERHRNKHSVSTQENTTGPSGVTKTKIFEQDCRTESSDVTKKRKSLNKIREYNSQVTEKSEIQSIFTQFCDRKFSASLDQQNLNRKASSEYLEKRRTKIEALPLDASEAGPSGLSKQQISPVKSCKYLKGKSNACSNVHSESLLQEDSDCIIIFDSNRYAKAEHPTISSKCVKRSKNSQHVSSVSTPPIKKHRMDSENCAKNNAKEHPDIRSLDSIKVVELSRCVDIMAIVTFCSNLQRISSDCSEKRTVKRNITVIDMSNTPMTIILWDEQAKKFSYLTNSVILARNVRIKEHQGYVMLESISTTVIKKMNPEASMSKRLLEWFSSTLYCREEEKITLQYNNNSLLIENLTTIMEGLVKIRAEVSGSEIWVKGCFISLQHNDIFYKGCPSKGCDKEVVKKQNCKGYRCSKCSTIYQDFKKRILINATISDSSGSLDVLFINETAEKIIGKSIEELTELEHNDTEGFINAIEKLEFKDFIFIINFRKHVFYDMEGNHVYIKSAIPIDRCLYSAYLHKKIEQGYTLNIE